MEEISGKKYAFIPETNGPDSPTNNDLLYVAGITLTEKWNTDNMLGTIIEVQDQFARGLKLTLDSSYAPQVGKRTGKVKAEWAAESAKVLVLFFQE